VSDIDAAAVRGMLHAHGMEFLAVIDDPQTDTHDRQVAVFLHGYAGTNQQMDAMDALRELDGVSSVEASSVSWTILIVRFGSDPGERG
jgi:hypothetical protein